MMTSFYSSGHRRSEWCCTVNVLHCLGKVHEHFHSRQQYSAETHLVVCHAIDQPRDRIHCHTIDRLQCHAAEMPWTAATLGEPCKNRPRCHFCSTWYCDFMVLGLKSSLAILLYKTFQHFVFSLAVNTNQCLITFCSLHHRQKFWAQRVIFPGWGQCFKIDSVALTLLIGC